MTCTSIDLSSQVSDAEHDALTANLPEIIVHPYNASIEATLDSRKMYTIRVFYNNIWMSTGTEVNPQTARSAMDIQHMLYLERETERIQLRTQSLIAKSLL
jgi:hypothetical protein